MNSTNLNAQSPVNWITEDLVKCPSILSPPVKHLTMCILTRHILLTPVCGQRCSSLSPLSPPAPGPPCLAGGGWLGWAAGGNASSDRCCHHLKAANSAVYTFTLLLINLCMSHAPGESSGYMRTKIEKSASS